MRRPSASSNEDSGFEISDVEKASERNRIRAADDRQFHHVEVVSAEQDQDGDNDTLIEACPDEEGGGDNNKRSGCANRKDVLQCIGSAVSHGLETLFYNLGHGIASRPWTVILCCFLVSALCGLGMIKFEVKDSSAPIWIPQKSKVLANQKWVEANFPLRVRYNMLIVTADNILSPEALQEMQNIDNMVKDMVEYNNSISDVYNYNWTSICIKFDTACFSRSLLELWEFDPERIEQFQTSTQIVNYLSSVKRSPVFKNPYKPVEWLGDLTYNVDGQIISAKAAKMLYVIKATSGDEMNTKIQAPDLLWEKRFIELGKKLGARKDNVIKSVEVQAIRSFRDESDQSFEADVMLLAAGIAIIICYVAVVMGKFNEVEHKVYLALVGVFGIGLAILVSYGLASAIGQFYGPIHPILPFLLLGLGVDDMFVIIEAWNNLSAAEKRKPLPEKVALTMKHAGVSITVTSVTDFVAFAIGASTALPALKSFCVYAALGILFLFIMQSTFFVAWLTIDQRRQDATRDACCIWIKYYNFEPNSCSQKQFLPWMLRKFIAPSLTTLPIKVLVLTLVACLLAVSSYGTYLLRTDSDLSWFLPTDSYLTKFLRKYESSFDEGLIADVYLGNISYYNETQKIQAFISELHDSGYVQEGTMANWHLAYVEWLQTDTAKDVGYYYYDFPWMYNDYPGNEDEYFTLLNVFVGKYEQQYYPLLKWNDSDPYNPRRLEASKFSFRLNRLESTEAEVECLDYLEDMTVKYYGDDSFVWSPSFRNWETNRVIGNELYTNLGLAFVAVFLVTLLLVANLWVCLLVCLSVIVTLVNVCGMMHFWGLTIDTLTSILLILSMGLAIDYSAHIGHTFMTIAGTRNERAKITVATMGSAVINGGFSTFLAFVLLATSNSYVFTTFFKVFFLVVVFGLFNGLALLPVLLSWLGPRPYNTATHKMITSNMSITLKDLSGSKHAVDIDKLLTGSRSKSIPNTSNTEKVEQYIHSLPDPTVVVTRPPRRHTVDSDTDSLDMPHDALLRDAHTPESQTTELDDMLTELEKSVNIAQPDQTEKEPHRVEIHFDDHKDVIKDCENYLRQSQ